MTGDDQGRGRDDLEGRHLLGSDRWHPESTNEGETLAALARIADDPVARVARRRRFYERTAGDLPGWCGGAGEVAFASWLARRGALAASPWYRAIQADLALHSELGERCLHDPMAPAPEGPVRLWREWLASRDPRCWYRAHNATVLDGALRYRELARAECAAERTFIAFNLYRILSMHAVLEGAVLGRAGALAVSPRLPWPRALLAVPRLYPRHYPATERDVARTLVRGLPGHGTWLQRLVDRAPLTLPPAQLFSLAAGWLALPSLPGLVRDGRVAYPGGGE